MADKTGNQINRQDVRAAIAKAMELRALHAALLHGNSPVSLGFPSVSPVPSHASAQEYPVFAPSYEEEPLPGYQQILLQNRNCPERSNDTVLSDHICPFEDQNSTKNSMASDTSTSSCNKCKPAVISSEPDGLAKNGKKSNVVVPLTDSSRSSLGSNLRSKGLGFSWMFPRIKKINKNESSPIQRQSNDVFVETLKKELIEANESRDAALAEVAEMKASLGELSQKLELLETHCEQLKSALTHVVQVKANPHPAEEKLTSFPRSGKSLDGISENSMVERFSQMVSESRSSVSQFCKTILSQIDETISKNLKFLLKPHNLSLNSRSSKQFSHHFEAIINQTLYEHFENPFFEKNGAPKILDPQKARQARFQSFVGLRNLSWNEVMRKGTKYYSEEFSRFCDQKMSGIVVALGWTRPWPEEVLQVFFVAAKCVWLLHLLAFSFDRPLRILRVDQEMVFDGEYMEDVFAEGQKLEGRVEFMVRPGFYVLDRVIKCKVLLQV